MDAADTMFSWQKYCLHLIYLLESFCYSSK
jgi:hypothetical protein